MAAGLNNTLLDIMVAAGAAAATHLSLHTAEPDASGSNAATSARVAASWPAGSAGDFGALSGKAFTGGAASGPCTHVGLWSASTAGTFYGYFALTGDQTFNAAGEYTLDSLSIPGSAT